MANKWTKMQEKAIESREGAMIVSASAGSGKTSVMIERLVRLIESGVDVDNVLCLTFTKAAAEEMKERLKKALLKRLKEEQNPEQKERWLYQLDKLPLSSITTIDAYCKKIVNKYFEKSGMPSGTVLASPEDAKALQYASASSTLEAFGDEEDEIYLGLVSFLGERRSEESILNLLLDVYDFLSSLPDPDGYLDSVLSYYNCPVDQNPVVEYRLMRIRGDLGVLKGMALQAKELDLPYPDDLYAHVLYLERKLQDGLWEIGGALKESFPEKPNFNKKPYNTTDKDARKILENLRNKQGEFIKTYEDFRVEDIEKDLKNLSPYVQKLVDIIRAFSKEYTARLRRDNLTDFAEIEHCALKILQNEDARRELCQKYTHVLVDEYQDTNRLQESILDLSGGGASDFKVGDVKQSIYSFRHAEPELFIERRHKEGVESVILKENFRQDGEIIDVINDIFRTVMTKEWTGTDYEDEAMVDGLKMPRGTEKPVTLLFIEPQKGTVKPIVQDVYSVKENTIEKAVDDSNTEGIIIYNKICELVDKKTIYDVKMEGDNKYRKIGYGDIVVLYRSANERTKAVVDFLKKKGIPVGEKREEKLPASAEILIHLLRVIDNPLQDESVAIVMLSELFSFTENELAMLRNKVDRGEKLYSSLYKIKEENPRLQEFFRKIEEYSFRSKYTDVYNLLDYVVHDTGYDKKIAEGYLGEGEYTLLSAYLNSLSSSAVGGSITEYLNHFDSYPSFSTKQETGGGEVVQFMTMHGSKGLEFPVVFFIDASKGFNPEDSKKTVVFHKKMGLGIPSFDTENGTKKQNYVEKTLKERIKDENAVQELRLLYVGLTRARNMLFVSGVAKKSADNKTLNTQATNMLDFIEIAMNINPKLEDKVNVETYVSGEVEIGDNVQQKEDKESFSVEEYKEGLNYSYPYALSTKTPTKYTVTALTKERHEDSPESTPIYGGESAEMGTLYHTVMERIDFSVKEEDEIEKELEKMLLDEVITQEQFAIIDREVLKKVMNSSIIEEIRGENIQREQGFLLRVPCNEIREDDCEDEVLLQGVIDLLVQREDEAIIVDYKYSSLSEDGLKERYYPQLALYKKAVEMITGIKKVRVYLLSLKTARLIELA